MKNKWIILITILVLAATVTVLAILNKGDTEQKQDSQDHAEVTITSGDETIAMLTLEDLKRFEKVEFDANLDTSDTDAVKKTFGGVLLYDVLSAYEIALDGSEDLVFVAADGYATVVTAEEVMQPGNIYLVYEREGKPSGTRAEGGTGPIEIVIAKDQFSQRWCKYLMEIQID